MPAELRELKPLPSRNCIETLERYLERAKTGELQSLAIVSIDIDGTTQREFSNDGYRGSKIELLGATELLKQLLIDFIVNSQGVEAKGS
jgi:hypothetical protein